MPTDLCTHEPSVTPGPRFPRSHSTTWSTKTMQGSLGFLLRSVASVPLGWLGRLCTCEAGILGSGTGGSLPVAQGRALLGRPSDCPVALPEQSVGATAHPRVAPKSSSVAVQRGKLHDKRPRPAELLPSFLCTLHGHHDTAARRIPVARALPPHEYFASK